MYTSYIGKKFLALYNEREGLALTAKEFFDEIFFPIFFESDKHLMHVGNSAFFQKPPQKVLDSGVGVPQARLQKLHEDVENEPPNMATLVGYGTKDICSTTSGQLTDIDSRIDQSDQYASWFGQALGIGISGGYVTLCDHDDMLLHLADGWRYYREFLDRSPRIKPNQVETWNGQWLCHRLGKKYGKASPADFDVLTGKTGQKESISTVTWPKVAFAIAREYGESQGSHSLTLYNYSLSQTNVTLGFVNLHLQSLLQMHQVRTAVLSRYYPACVEEEFLESYEPFYGLAEATRLGLLSIRALEPRGLRKYMPRGTFRYAQGLQFRFKDQHALFTFQCYKAWILCMLNGEDDHILALSLAKALHTFEAHPSRASIDRKERVKATKILLQSRLSDELANNISEHLEDGYLTSWKEMSDQVLGMGTERFALFITLVGFEYYYQKKYVRSILPGTP